jgi:hypothetical protein
MDKIKYYVDDLLKKFNSGEEFFDKLDEVIRLPKNVDIIQKLFDIIYKEQGNTFNVIVSGKFGDWIKYLVEKSIIKVNGNLIMVKGSLRLNDTNLNRLSYSKYIDVIYKKNDIEDKDYIFIDDSFYSGSTKKSIEEWLKLHNSRIIKTYVIYDGNDKKFDDLKSLYRYYDYHTGKILPVIKLFEILDKIKYDIPFDYNIVFDKISKGEIRTSREMFNFIKNVSSKLHKNFNFDLLYNIKHYESIKYKLKYLKNFKNFN